MSKAGQTVRPMMMATPASTINRAATSKPAAEASRCVVAWIFSSSSSISGHDEDKYGHHEHRRDEQGRDSRVIGFVRSDVEFHES